MDTESPNARSSYDVVVIGAGHNGLVAGAYLAKAGLRTLILERRDDAGGCAVTSPWTRGVRGPAVAHTIGRLRPRIVRDLGLRRFGLRFIEPEVRVFAPQPDGRAVTLWGDPARTAQELRAHSPRDGDAYEGFDRRVRVLASFVAHLNATVPPDLGGLKRRDAVAGLRLARWFRALGPKPSRELLRVLPMAVADFVGEAFESDPVRAAVAVRGVHLTAMGPWSAGTTAVLLADSAGNDGGAAGQATMARGGPGALAAALEAAARSFGAEIRTGAGVAAVTSNGSRATGVALESGEEVRARTVVGAIDPKALLLRLVDPVVLGPTLRWRAENLRLPGVVAKVNLTLSGLPSFTGNGEDGERRLRGRIVIAPGIDDLERAFDASKYGRISERPYLEATIPTLTDPTLAPDGGHVMSVIVQYAPYRLAEGEWRDEAGTLRDRVLATLEERAPGISGLVSEAEVLTPRDLEQEFSLTEGHPLHGEPGLDQFFAWRPLLGHASYRVALDGLYLCGAGAHPGGGISGWPALNAVRVILSDLKRGTS